MNLSSVVMRRALAGTAVSWPLLMLASVYAAARVGDDLWRALALAVYGLGSVVCHQDIDRSFLLGGVPFPVCARCAGLYVGAGASALSSWAWEVGIIDTRRVRIVLAAASVPTLLTLVYEWTTGIAPSNTIRAASGVILGVAVMAVLLGPFQPAAAGARRASTNRRDARGEGAAS